jgi:hypothetical protein
MVYFQGSPGWPNQKTNFDWQVNHDPANINMMVGTVPARVKYWMETDEVELQGKRYKRSNSNVFLVSRIDEAAPVVVPLGIHDLAFKPDDIPPVILLRRDADVWAALSGHSANEHPSRQSSSVPEEILGWDREGVRLLNTQVPDDERKGCELLRRAATKGYAPSQYRLGYCYQSGRGVAQSFPEANQWYEKAALQGYMDAQYKLAYSYQTGRGVQIDLPTALKWYKKAAEVGDRDALYNVGMMYATGQGLKADQQEAYGWFLRSAEHGEVAAEIEVVRRLKEGEGVSKDLVLAYSWLLVLQAQHPKVNPEVQNRMQAIATGVEDQLDAPAKLRAQTQSREWMAAISVAEMDRYSRQ